VRRPAFVPTAPRAADGPTLTVPPGCCWSGGLNGNRPEAASRSPRSRASSAPVSRATPLTRRSRAPRRPRCGWPESGRRAPRATQRPVPRATPLARAGRPQLVVRPRSVPSEPRRRSSRLSSSKRNLTLRARVWAPHSQEGRQEPSFAGPSLAMLVGAKLSEPAARSTTVSCAASGNVFSPPPSCPPRADTCRPVARSGPVA